MRETRTLANGAVASWESPDDVPAWAEEIPDFVLECVSRLQPALRDGLQISVRQNPERPGVFELVGVLANEQDVARCLVCADTVGAELVSVLPPRGMGGNVGVDPSGKVCMPCVCHLCARHLAGDGGPSA